MLFVILSSNLKCLLAQLWTLVCLDVSNGGSHPWQRVHIIMGRFSGGEAAESAPVWDPRLARPSTGNLADNQDSQLDRHTHGLLFYISILYFGFVYRFLLTFLLRESGVGFRWNMLILKIERRCSFTDEIKKHLKKTFFLLNIFRIVSLRSLQIKKKKKKNNL